MLGLPLGAIGRLCSLRAVSSGYALFAQISDLVCRAKRVNKVLILLLQSTFVILNFK